MEGQEFASQLAQFSSLEQLLNINTSLNQNGELNGLLAQSINSGVAAGLIGKEIEAEGNSINVNADSDLRLQYELASAASDVTLEIKNEAGITVRTIEIGSRTEGEHAYGWDGKNDAGEAVTEGNYTFEITAKDDSGESISARTLIRGTVDRVTFGGDGIQLWIGDTAVAMGAVNSVREN